VTSAAVEVRELRAEDEPELARLAAEALAPQIEGASVRAETGRALATAERDVVFVADAGGHLAGYVALRTQGDALLLEQLAVAEIDQGQRVGHRLLDWAEGYGVSQGLACVRVRVAPDDRRARDFYARRGYLPSGEDTVERALAHEE
jgi:ribosomal protein S18 acetylase RimI-like enzyme